MREHQVTRTGKIIYNTLKTLFEHKVYPLVAEQSTKFPFCIYQTTMSRPTLDKDLLFCDWVYDIKIDIVDTDYDNVVELCDNALDLLMELTGEYDVEITGVLEDYREDAYVKEIQMTLKS